MTSDLLPPILKIHLSVIICTHNPRAAYLRRTLDALKEQTLSKEQWELLLIDNASMEPLSGQWDLSWHPQGRIFCEKELGLTTARLRGIRESAGRIQVFVDDDNLLDPEYLAQVVRIGIDRGDIGAWGGEVLGEFEDELPEWLEPHVECLAIRALNRDAWSNLYGWSPALPIGAGMCLRREVAEHYSKLCAEHPLRRELDRRGKSLSCGGDLDMAYCAIDMGMGIARFKCLRLLHLVPSMRLQRDYLLRIISGARCAAVLVDSLRDETRRIRPRIRPQWCNIRFLWQWFRAGSFERSVLAAAHRGEKLAWQILQQSNSPAIPGATSPNA